MSLESLFADGFKNDARIRSHFVIRNLPEDALTQQESFLLKSYLLYLLVYQYVRKYELHEGDRRFNILTKIPFIGDKISAANNMSRVAKHVVSELDNLQYLYSMDETSPIRNMRFVANLLSSLIVSEAPKVKDESGYDSLKEKCVYIFDNWAINNTKP